MRNNLTKKEIVNSMYMQLGFPKKVCENLLEDFLSIILEELRACFSSDVIKFAVPSAVFNAIFPVNPSVTITFTLPSII